MKLRQTGEQINTAKSWFMDKPNKTDQQKVRTQIPHRSVAEMIGGSRNRFINRNVTN